MFYESVLGRTTAVCVRVGCESLIMVVIPKMTIRPDWTPVAAATPSSLVTRTSSVRHVIQH